MTFTDVQINSWIASTWLPFLRIDAAVMAAPLFGSSYVPGRVRILMGFVIALIIVPLLPPAPGVNPMSVEGVVLAVNELLLGICMGLLIQLVFEAVVFAGQTISMGMGLGFAMLVDPQRGVSVPVLSQFFLLLTLLLFLALGGHLTFLRVIAESFQTWPVGGGVVGVDTLAIVLAWVSQMFKGAMQIALPAMIALLVVQFAVGVISRAAPTLNLFAVGFPLAILIGYLVLEQVVPTLPPILDSLLTSAFDALGRLLETVHG